MCYDIIDLQSYWHRLYYIHVLWYYWFTELLASFVEQTSLKQHYKSRLVGTVLNGYLSLKKLVVQRTKLIDDTQDKLLELLEEMTTGQFMLW